MQEGDVLIEEKIVDILLVTAFPVQNTEGLLGNSLVELERSVGKVRLGQI